MNISLILMSKLLGMVLMVVAGYLAVRLRIVESKESVTLTRLTIYIFQPCMILRSFQIDLTPERLNGFVTALLLGTVTYLLWIPALELLGRPLRLDAVDRCTLIYSNVGNLALPIIDMILGPEFVFYASALQVPFNLLFWTYGLRVISGEKRMDFRKILLNPNLIALALGLLLTGLHIRLPDFLDTAMNGLGSMVGNCTMLVIGMVITRHNLRKIFTDPRAYGIPLGRLLAMPASLLLLFFVSGVFGRFPQAKPVVQVCFIALCTPPAASISQLAVLYENKAYESSVYSVVSMALCALTMPAMLALFQLMFGG